MQKLKSLFLLDPDVVFLNHGSFGACPRPVFDAYQAWQRRLEQQPVQFINHEIPEQLRVARQALGAYLNAGSDDLVYVPNATFAVNVVARSLALGPEDEVLATNHEYGACRHVWQFLSEKRGFTYRERPIPLPVTSAEEIVEQFWQGVTPKTRLIFASHITSPTAVRMPVEEICRRARNVGILTLIDGAHAPGQIPIDLEAIGPDFYAGNAHKWLCAPKGSAFLYVRPERQGLIEPLVVGWGWGAGWNFTFGTQFLDYLQWLGTNDLSAYLAVPAAIQFQADHDWTAVRKCCHQLAQQAVARIGRLTGLGPLQTNVIPYDRQMVIAPLPAIDDLWAFKSRLYAKHRVEVPCIQWEDHQLLRLSVQGYNSQEDIDALVEALADLLPGTQRNQRTRRSNG